MKYFLLFFLAMYMYFVLKNFYTIWKIRKLINVLSDYLNSATLSNSCLGKCLITKENYQQCLKEVLFYYPVIAKFQTCSDFLGYGIPETENYIAAYRLYNNLMMRDNSIVHAFTESLNPIYTLKRIFHIPSSFISWMGFKPSIIFSRLFNAFSWIVTYLLGVYSQETKYLISTLIHK